MVQLRAAVVHPPASQPARKPLARRWLGENPDGWSFTMPAIVIILGLSILPMCWSLVLSLQHSDLLTPATWIGFRNYQTLAQDPKFGAAVAHTLIYSALFVPLSVGGGLVLAVLLNRRIRFSASTARSSSCPSSSPRSLR